MGWERKRGKLLDLNNLLLGKHNNFSLIAGDRALLNGIKYVITLDADTQLPRDAARKLVAVKIKPELRGLSSGTALAIVLHAAGYAWETVYLLGVQRRATAA